MKFVGSLRLMMVPRAFQRRSAGRGFLSLPAWRCGSVSYAARWNTFQGDHTHDRPSLPYLRCIWGYVAAALCPCVLAQAVLLKFALLHDCSCVEFMPVATLSLSVEDLDGDGDLDAAVVCMGGTNKIIWFANSGAQVPTFIPRNVYPHSDIAFIPTTVVIEEYVSPLRLSC